MSFASPAQVLAVLLAAVMLLWLGVLLIYGRRLLVLWRDPVLSRPVLVIESDDWGAGPLAQAEALRSVAGVLARHADATGRPPCMSLAIVLAVPDAPRMGRGEGFQRIELDAPLFRYVLDELRAGVSQRVLALQLHGHEHFRPSTLMASADPAVREWLASDALPPTEGLPSHLQSRWVDAGVLPSRALERAEIEAAAAAECAAFARIVGEPPRAVVPPTFVWTREVERAWAACGVEFVVTPGWRSTLRNAQGLPDGDEGPIANGDLGGDHDGDRGRSLCYLVRSDYFEPARGRDAAHALRALERAVAEGRPCILENHRDNFIFDAEQSRRSLEQLDALCAGALRQHPGLRFLSTVELGRIVRERDPQWIISGWRERLPVVWQRLQRTGRLWKLARLSGVALLGGWLVMLLGARPLRGAGSARS